MKGCNPHVLSRYLDGELRLSARREVEDHLQGCARCTKELEDLRRLDEVVDSWGRTRRPMPVESEMRILQSVDRRHRLRPVRALKRMMPAAVGSSIAAVLVLLSANLGWLYPGAPHVASPGATVQIQRSRAGQQPLALDMVRVNEITGRRGNVHPDLEAKFRAMFNVD